MFTGFTDETIQFLLDIRFHNSVEYYNENKDRFVRCVKEPFEALIADLAPEMQKIDAQMEIRPYRCLARLRRDVRFTRDKSPYKDHLWLTFRRAGEPREGSLGFWYGIGPEWQEGGLGFWGDNVPVMDRLRREIVADPERILRILRSCPLKERNLQLSVTPIRRMAVPGNIPLELVPLYTAKSLYIQQTTFTPAEAGSRALFEKLLGDYQAMAPIYQLLRGMQDELQQAEEAKAAQPVRVDEW